jgi:hypothetical protein
MERNVAQEVARRGKEIYEREIRAEVEPEQEGRFLVVDVNSGSYALADDELEAFDRAQAKTPEGVLYLIRVGRRQQSAQPTCGPFSSCRCVEASFLTVARPRFHSRSWVRAPSATAPTFKSS